jgi:hypothetical protein
MSRKRRQRSTKIRKRAEKKQREDAKAKKRQAKLAGDGAIGLLRMNVPRTVATSCVAALTDLETRITAAPIRGWSIDDLSQTHGLSWLRGCLAEALEGPDGEVLTIEYPEDAKGPIWDQLDALDRVASGLGVAWEDGFPEVRTCIGDSVEVPPEIDEEDEEGEEGEDDEDGEDDEETDDEDA